jgi:hypothetical protein
MHMVAQHLKGEDGSADGDGRKAKVPMLKRLLVWTDGHSSTYKGFPNFGRMGHWPLKKPSSADEATVISIKLDLLQTSEISVDRKLLVLSLDGDAAHQVEQATGAAAATGADATGAQNGAGAGLAAAEDVPTKDPRKLKVAELRTELKSRGLNTSGLKGDLVKRLSEAMDAEGMGGSKCFRVMSVEGVVVDSVESYNAALLACTGAVSTVGLIEVRLKICHLFCLTVL